MKDNFNIRLKKVLYSITPAEQFNTSKIARDIGISHTGLDNYMNYTEPKFDCLSLIIQYIKKHIPDFDTDYLLMQSDTMIKGNDKISKTLNINESTIESIKYITNKNLSSSLSFMINNKFLPSLLKTIDETYKFISNDEMERLINISIKNITDNKVDYLNDIDGRPLRRQFLDNRQIDLYMWHIENAFKLCINEIMAKSINKSIKNRLKPYYNKLDQIEQNNHLKSLEENEEYQKIINDKTYIALCFLDTHQELIHNYRGLLYANMVKNPLS